MAPMLSHLRCVSITVRVLAAARFDMIVESDELISACVVSMKPNSVSSLFKFIASFAPSVRALYSAFVVERDTIGCHLLAHDTAPRQD